MDSTKIEVKITHGIATVNFTIEGTEKEIIAKVDELAKVILDAIKK